MNIITLARAALLGALGLVVAAIGLPAQAGVATMGAVLLDPFDPVPEIQFHHFGGYGCDYGCGGGYRGCGEVCGRSCYDGCRRHYYRHTGCGDGCRRYVRDDCDRDCGRRDCRDDCRRYVRDDCDHDCDRHDGDHEHDGRPPAPPCASDHCYDAEHYERRWRDGDHVGQEWLDRGTRERTMHDDHGNWYGHGDTDWHDYDDAPPPPPPPPPDDHDHDHDHHDRH
ncbi:MAG: hypothetical protein WDM86_22380 [Rhizomicrobium sp.]